MTATNIPAVVALALGDAQRLLGEQPSGDPASAPAVARRLRHAGARAVCLVDVETVDGRRLTWLDTEHARGWLASAPDAAPAGGDPQLFANQLAAAMAKGFVAADAAVLAMMAATAGPAEADFIHDPKLLPQLSWGEQARFAQPAAVPARRLDLYAIVDSAERVRQVLAAGVRTVQLRIKTPARPQAHWYESLRSEIQSSVAIAAAADAELFINDHWQLGADLGARGVHLGQEDLLALGDAGRSALQVTGMAIGISSHSLWELCRARTLQPRYIACGPVWPTLTKAMPWRAQGLDNLSWWCRMAQAPVVAIGGILGADQVFDAARYGADGICIVRGLGDHPEAVVPTLQDAMESGRASAANADLGPGWPHPSLAG